jgi:hypothetical protein
MQNAKCKMQIANWRKRIEGRSLGIRFAEGLNGCLLSQLSRHPILLI